ncbi:MAG: ABC transporter ATP-binding protein [Bacteroidia bacterium]|nr:ABC transporter ATP-binding protein [Bacteroidia bacterium]
MASHPKLQTRSLSKAYTEGETHHPVVRAVDFELAPGETVVLVGRSGSGKSTLLHLLAGIDLPDSGEVWIDGEPMTGISETQRTRLRRRKLGLVFQFFNLIPTLSVLENVLLPLELVGQRGPAAKRAATELLEAVGLAHRTGVFPDRLSGGEQQRVALARALVHQPSLLLADEPTGNLDAENAQRVLALMRRLVKDVGHSQLIVTHNPEVLELADRVLHLVDGKLVPAPTEIPAYVQ